MTTKDTVFIALFAALTAALGLVPQISLASGVPITAQSFGVMLAGVVLGAKRGGLAIALFLLLAMAGLPILSGGRGGLSVFLGPTGGFLIGFPIGAFVIGLLCAGRVTVLGLPLTIAFILLGGVGVIYLFGVPWLAYVADMPLLKAIMISTVYLPGDAIKAVLAALIARQLAKAFPDL